MLLSTRVLEKFHPQSSPAPAAARLMKFGDDPKIAATRFRGFSTIASCRRFGDLLPLAREIARIAA